MLAEKDVEGRWWSVGFGHTACGCLVVQGSIAHAAGPFRGTARHVVFGRHVVSRGLVDGRQNGVLDGKGCERVCRKW
jgi:hypothetical protein